MSSHPSDSRHMERRDSSSSTKRRPRLLRASATEPSLTASNASRGALVAPQSSSRRATDILNRMAYIGSSSPPSSQSILYDRMGRNGEQELCSSPTSANETLDDIHTRPRASYLPNTADLYHDDDLTPSASSESSARYFSFPSFDAWDAEGQEEKDADMKSDG